MKLCELDMMIKAACPIDGISSDGLIWFTQQATDAQKESAQEIMNDNILHIDREEILTI